jgi:hypothetical protein
MRVKELSGERVLSCKPKGQIGYAISVSRTDCDERCAAQPSCDTELKEHPVMEDMFPPF